MSRSYDCSSADERREGIAAAVGAIGDGKLVVVPTDTVYGVAADAFTPRAVDALLAAKGRGRHLPVPVLVSSWHMLDGVVEPLPPAGEALGKAFWPGALTLVTWHSPALAWDLGDSRGTVAVRMPLHPLTLDLLALTGPLATSSANISGMPPATTAADAVGQLGNAVAVYLDAGPTGDAVASTIVDVTAEVPRILRRGALPVDELREVAPDIDDHG